MNLPGVYQSFLDKWSSYQSVYVISDPHFDDDDVNLIPSAEIVKRINSKVGKKDVLIILGDVGNPEWVKKLRGYKILIMGNHDAGRSNYERNIITRVFNIGDDEDFQEENAINAMKRAYPGCQYSISKDNYPSACWSITADNLLFDEIYEGPVMLGEKLILSHEPIDVPWAFNLHGHTHDRHHKNDKRHLNCCAEIIDYTPINLNQFLRSGATSKIETIHRTTINKATERKKKKERKRYLAL